MSNWHLVHTKIRQEHVAQSNLERQGYACYLPKIKAEKLRAGELKVIEEPLFPRYLFIKLETGLDAKSWAPIRSTLGVSRLVTFGQTPAKIDDDLLESIRARSESADVQLRHFAPGEQVIVTQGPFTGVEALYQMADGQERVVVLLTILSKQVRMTVPPTSIRKSNSV